MSKPIFVSNSGLWSVWMCACGCDVQVKATAAQMQQLPGPPRFYARHHAPLGADPVRTCPTWDGTYEQEPQPEPQETTSETKDPFDLEGWLGEMFDDYDTDPA